MGAVNSQGRGVLGHQGVLSVDGQAFSQLLGTYFGGGARLRTDEWIVVQRCVGENCSLVEVHIDTAEVRELSPIGAWPFAAGGGHWAGFLSGGPHVGVRASHHGPWPTFGLLDVGRDGTIALIDTYHEPQRIKLVAPDGREMSIDARNALHARVLRFGVGVWTNVNHQVGAFGVEAPDVPSGAIVQPQIIEAGGRNLLLYWHASGTWLSEWKGLRGCRVFPAGEDAHSLDAAVLANGSIKVIRARGAGETPESYHYRIVTQDQISELIESAPSPTELVVRPFKRPVWTATYHENGQYGFTEPGGITGNALLLVEKEGDPQKIHDYIAHVRDWDVPVILSSHRIPDAEFERKVVFRWLAGANLSGLEHSVQSYLALSLDKPINAYLDRPERDAWPEDRPLWVTNRVRPDLQIYPEPGESVEQFRGRAFFICRRVYDYGVPFGLTVALFDRNGRVAAEHILTCAVVYDELMQEFGDLIVTFFMFAGKRPGGMSTYNILQDAARKFVAASTRPHSEEPNDPDNDEGEEPMPDPHDTQPEGPVDLDKVYKQTRTASQLAWECKRLLQRLCRREGISDDPNKDD